MLKTRTIRQVRWHEKDHLLQNDLVNGHKRSVRLRMIGSLTVLFAACATWCGRRLPRLFLHLTTFTTRGSVRGPLLLHGAILLLPDRFSRWWTANNFHSLAIVKTPWSARYIYQLEHRFPLNRRLRPASIDLSSHWREDNFMLSAILLQADHPWAGWRLLLHQF